MTTFRLNMSLEKWIHQNKAEYTGDFFDGCLLDNFIVACKNGVAALYEHCLNEWSSCYEVHFGRTPEEINAVYSEFYRMERMIEEN